MPLCAASTGLMITSGFGWMASNPSMFKCCERKVVWILVPVLRTSGYFPASSGCDRGLSLGSIYSGKPGYPYSSSKIEKISILPVGVGNPGCSSSRSPPVSYFLYTLGAGEIETSPFSAERRASFVLVEEQNSSYKAPFHLLGTARHIPISLRYHVK